MRVGNFSVLIPEGRETDSGHVALTHGTVFSVRLLNHWNNRRCDALVTMDGKTIGDFRVDPHGSIRLETPPHDPNHQQFTFYEAGSAESVATGGGKVASDDRGLIQVKFRPEHQRPSYDHPITLSSASRRSLVRDLRPTMRTHGLESEEKTAGGLDFAERIGSRDPLPTVVRAGTTGLSGHSDQRFVEAPGITYDPSQETVITLRLVCLAPTIGELKPAPAANPVPRPVL